MAPELDIAEPIPFTWLSAAHKPLQ